MQTLSKVRTSFQKTPAVVAQLEQLISVFDSHNTLTADVVNWSIDISLLTTENVLSTINGTHVLAISEKVTYAFYSYYSRKLSYSVSDDFDAIFDFIHQIEQRYPERKDRVLLDKLTKAVTALLALTVHIEQNGNVTNYITGFDMNNRDRFYELNEWYCTIASHLNIEAADYLICFSSLTYGIGLGNFYSHEGAILGKAAREVGKLKPTIAAELLQLTRTSVDFHTTSVNLLFGLYENNPVQTITLIEQLYLIKEQGVLVICTLSGIKATSKAICTQFTEIISTRTEFDESEKANLPQFYCNLLSSTDCPLDIQTHCKIQLRELLITGSQSGVFAVLRELQFLDNQDLLISELLKELVRLPTHEHTYDRAIGDCFVRHTEIDSFFEFLSEYACHRLLEFDSKHFSSAIYTLRHQNPDQFSTKLIELLTDNRGEVRFIGNRVLTHLILHNRGFRFETNLLALSAVIQFKLIITVLAGLSEPKEKLPLVLCLLNSSYAFVQEVLICKMEELTENYHGAVLSVLSQELDSTSPWFSEVLERIRLFNEELIKVLNKKRGVRELDPKYTQSKIFHSFYSQYQITTGSKVRKQAHDESLWSKIASTVILAKGGGWKHEGKEGISQLSRIETSFMLPRKYFIAPEVFDAEFQLGMSENWENYIKRWEAIISL